MRPTRDSLKTGTAGGVGCSIKEGGDINTGKGRGARRREYVREERLSRMADPRIAEAATCKLTSDLVRQQNRSGVRVNYMLLTDGEMDGRRVADPDVVRFSDRAR